MDLLLVEDKRIVDGLQYLAPLGKSDHIVIEISLTLNTDNRSNTNSYPMYNKANFAAMREESRNIDWETEL